MAINAQPLVSQQFKGIIPMVANMPSPLDILGMVQQAGHNLGAAIVAPSRNAAVATAATPVATQPVVVRKTDGSLAEYAATDPRYMDNYAFQSRTSTGLSPRLVAQVSPPRNAAPAAPATPAAPVMPAPTTPVAPVMNREPTAAILSSTYTGGHTAMPALQSTSVQQMVTPAQYVDALDHHAAARQHAAQYADMLANGVTPVLSNADQMATNILRARQNAALTAATKSADQVAAYRATNDPTLRNLAQDISATQGVSFDTAIKMAMAGKLTEQGNYHLANTYESSTLLPAMEAEHQRNIVTAMETGANMPTPTDFMGNAMNMRTGFNAITNTPDGNLNVLAPNVQLTATPDGARDMLRLRTSTNPVADAHTMATAVSRNNIDYARGRQQMAAAQSKAVTDNVAKQFDHINKATELQSKAAQNAFNAQSKVLQQQLKAVAPDTIAPRTARVDSPAQMISALNGYLRYMAEDDPRREQVIRQIQQLSGLPVVE